MDLYGQIRLRQANQPQLVQLVVNKIDKDRIHGYVSAPRYTESELTSSEAQPSTDAISKPISTPIPTSSSYSTSNPSSTSATTSQGQQSP